MKSLNSASLQRPFRAAACRGGALALLSLAACSSPTPIPLQVLEPPPLALDHQRRRGSEFVPVAPDAPIDFDGAVGVRIDILFLDHVSEGLDALPPRIEAIGDLHSAQPFVVEASWLRGGVVEIGEPARELFQRWQARPAEHGVFLGSVEDVLPLRSSIQAAAFLEEIYRDRADFLGEFSAYGPLRRTMAVHVGSGGRGEPLRLAVSSQDLDKDAVPRVRASVGGAVLPVRRDQRSTQVALLDSEVFAEGVALIALPSIFLQGDRGVIAALIQKAEPQFSDELREAWSQAPVPVQVFPVPVEVESRRLARTLRTVNEAGQRKAALCLLALQLNAGMAEDLVGYGEPVDLDRLAAQLPGGAEESLPSRDQLRWTMERAAYAIAVERVLEFEPRLELEGCLLRRAGELGRDTGGLAEVLNMATSLEELEDLFVEENLYALDASDASARVRAHDWLETHGVTVADYDPLGPLEERRRALVAAAVEEGS